MTDRAFVYPTAIPQTKDVLRTSKFAMLGDAFLALATLGNDASNPSPVISGLNCTPTTPASLQVNIGPGSIFQMDATDVSAYGDLGTDFTQIFKMGTSPETETLTINPPTTVGFSQVFLVQAILSNVDAEPFTLTYYNASIPSMPYSGPSNSGTSQFTTREVRCTVALKAGVASATGSQVTPSPDAGYVALYAITVANGQSQITTSHIVKANGGYAPFVNTALPYIPSGVQSGKWIYGEDTSVTRSVITVNLNPALPAYTAGLSISIKVANAASGASTIAINGQVAKSVTKRNGAPTQAFDFLAGDIIHLVYDGTKFQMIGSQATPLLAAPMTYYVATTGNDSNDGLTALTPFLTIQKAIDTVINFNLNGYSVTVNVANGTYPPVDLKRLNGSGMVNIIGNTTTSTSCIISAASVSGGYAVVCSSPDYSMSGFSYTTPGPLGGSPGAGIWLGVGSSLKVSNINFGACGNASTPGSWWVANDGGYLHVSGAITINGSTYFGFGALANGQIRTSTPTKPTLNITAPVSVSHFARAESGAFNVMGWASITGSGNVTGAKYSATSNGIIETGGAGVNYLPGTTAGATATGGQYV